ncbi:MAG TPA: hypothetical protein VFK40_08425 [Nitrososphaeraceae archaeon]|nr:hypothetical protein [Nitrososphaeraceae archaeon]
MDSIKKQAYRGLKSMANAPLIATLLKTEDETKLEIERIKILSKIEAKNILEGYSY